MSATGHDTPSHCENCNAPLQGHYCHDCGQSVVNPVRDARHALEEVFESFWHLDGRIFRTLRDLVVPGRVAVNYLAGQRARYVAPLRLFLVLSVVTFFFAQMAIHVENNEGANPMVQLEDGVSSNKNSAKQSKAFAKAASIADVEQIRRRNLADLAEARSAVPSVLLHARKAIDVAIADVNHAADSRIEAIGREKAMSAEQVAAAKADGQRRANEALETSKQSMDKAEDLTTLERLRVERLVPHQVKLAGLPASAAAARRHEFNEIRDINIAAGCRAAKLQIAVATSTEGSRARKESEDARIYGDPDCYDRLTLFGSDEPWDEETNPLVISWAPAFFNHWVNRQIAHGRENVSRAQKDPSLYVRALLAAVPSALFLLVPVFALLLKLAYLGSGRRYLEHLVVALYSHAFMCLAMLAFFVSIALDNAISPQWSGFGWISGTLETLLWLWLPVYLWLMQKRVYGNGWIVTTVRYLVIGNLYFVLLAFAATFLALASVVRM
ncbi:DUF3667 domain-containing protein [Lysobacter sp. TAF61]|uniref:DUF3667 domain-containing protein n=1 Tax=Lysobacter sp. TAF61 TaxID=3233072 RepID=UPI003F9D39EC